MIEHRVARLFDQVVALLFTRYRLNGDEHTADGELRGNELNG